MSFAETLAMPDPNLPSHVTVNLASLLTGASPRHIRYLTRAGLLPAEVTAGGHLRIALADVEKIRGGSPITTAEYLEAERKFDRTRGAYNRNYNQRRSHAGRMAAGERIVPDDDEY